MARAAQRAILQRTFTHARIRKVCGSWWGTEQRGTVAEDWRPAVGAPTVSADLQLVADAVVEIQEARHDADYDVGGNFTRQDVLELVRRAERAFEAWARVEATGGAEPGAFLLALLVW